MGTLAGTPELSQAQPLNLDSAPTQGTGLHLLNKICQLEALPKQTQRFLLQKRSKGAGREAGEGLSLVTQRNSRPAACRNVSTPTNNPPQKNT